MLKKITAVAFLSIIVISLACNKNESGIPNLPVNITLYSSDPLFYNLNPIGGWLYYEGGSRGILIYRKSTEEILAFDRHCPYQAENPCGRISVDSSNSFVAVDTCCQSKFLLLDGSLNSGPSTFPLKRYNSNFDGYKLVVYN